MKPNKRNIYNQQNIPSDNYNPWTEADKCYFLGNKKESSFSIFSVIVAVIAAFGIGYGFYSAIELLSQ